MLYSDYITRVADLLDIAVTITDATKAAPSSDPNFNNMIAASIDYTENRLQRDFDFLGTRITDQSATLTANSRFFTLPTSVGVFVVVEQLSPVVAGSRRQSLIPVSRAYLDTTYPSDAPPFIPSIPIYYAMYDQANILVGPAPDQPYPIEVVGTRRVPQLAATPVASTSNFLTIFMPDLYIACSMVFWSGYQRDFGSQADDPKMAMSWETTYQNLAKSAMVEELRKKWEGPAWTSKQPSPMASPQRT
jgi:hypothetical protein